MKARQEAVELRRTRHEWECKSIVRDEPELRRVGGRWQVRRGDKWRDLDPPSQVGEPVQ